MNTANLQLEGLYLAVASLTEAMVEKGLLTREEVDTALERAETAAINDLRSPEELKPANRDAVAFAPRLLRHANARSGDAAALSFQALARKVAQTKQPYDR